MCLNETEVVGRVNALTTPAARNVEAITEKYIRILDSNLEVRGGDGV